jgi:hypothetical protein
MTYIKSFILILVVLSMTSLNINIKSQAATRTETKTVNFGNPMDIMNGFDLITKNYNLRGNNKNIIEIQGAAAIENLYFNRGYSDNIKLNIGTKFTSKLVGNNYNVGLYLKNFINNSNYEQFDDISDLEIINVYNGEINSESNSKVYKYNNLLGQEYTYLGQDSYKYQRAGMMNTGNYVTVEYPRIVSRINQNLNSFVPKTLLSFDDLIKNKNQLIDKLNQCNQNVIYLIDGDNLKIKLIKGKSNILNLNYFDEIMQKGPKNIIFENQPDISTPILINGGNSIYSFYGINKEDSNFILSNGIKNTAKNYIDYFGSILGSESVRSDNYYGQVFVNNIDGSALNKKIEHFPFISNLSCEISTQTEIKPSLSLEIKASNGTDTQTIISGDPARLKIIYKNTGNEEILINKSQLYNVNGCEELPIFPGNLKVGQTIEYDCTIRGIKVGTLKDNLLVFEVSRFDINTKEYIPIASDTTTIIVKEPIKKIPKVTLDVRAPDGTDSQTISPGDPIELKLIIKNTGNEDLISPIFQSYVRIPCKGGFDSFPSILKIGEVSEVTCTLSGVQPEWLTNNQVKIGLKASGIESNTFSEQVLDTSTVLFKPKLKIIPKSSPWYYFMKMLENNPEMYNRVLLFLNL